MATPALHQGWVAILLWHSCLLTSTKITWSKHKQIEIVGVPVARSRYYFERTKSIPALVEMECCWRSFKNGSIRVSHQKRRRSFIQLCRDIQASSPTWAIPKSLLCLGWKERNDDDYFIVTGCCPDWTTRGPASCVAAKWTKPVWLARERHWKMSRYRRRNQRGERRGEGLGEPSSFPERLLLILPSFSHLPLS